MATNIAINPKVKSAMKVYSKKNPVFIRGLNKLYGIFENQACAVGPPKFIGRTVPPAFSTFFIGP